MSIEELGVTLYLYAGPVGILVVFLTMSYFLVREIGALQAAGKGLFPEEEPEEENSREA
jgi:hypothetical protein